MYIDPERAVVIQRLIRQQIETKLIYQDFRKTVPAENMPNVEQAITRQFEQTELKKLLKQENVPSREELEWKLRAKGTSIDREKRGFMERTVAQQWIRQQIKLDDEITHEQMLTWYQAHATEFDKPARAKWEELMVRTSKYPSKEEARQAIAQMGNQVLSGVPFAQVAKTQSDGSTATAGGARDWTSKGSLVAEDMDRALFGLPLGQMSQIMESPTGLHILRVTEREAASRTPFLEAQVDVRDKIRQERTKKQLQEYVSRLQKQYPVWTVFDDPSAKPQVSGRPETPRY
jgi:parvulin-like peptidyl-prolyl isomerase